MKDKSYSESPASFVTRLCRRQGLDIKGGTAVDCGVLGEAVQESHQDSSIEAILAMV